jgi:hypothetical protein
MSVTKTARSAALAVAVIAWAPFAAASAQDAHRVSLRFTSGQFSVQALTSLRSALAPSDELPAVAGGVSGFWYELQTAAGVPRYRRVLGDPVRLYFEGQRAAPLGEPPILDRHEQIPQSRLFTLLIPRAVTGEQLVLYGSPLVAGFGEQPATVLARLTLAVPAEGAP